MGPVLLLGIGLVAGAITSCFTMWLLARRKPCDFHGDVSRKLRSMVGRGILPGHVWEQIVRDFRDNSSDPVRRKSPGEAVRKNQTRASGFFLFALSLLVGIMACLSFTTEAWILGVFALLLGFGTALVPFCYPSSLTGLTAWIWGAAGISSCVLAALSNQNFFGDPHPTLVGAWWGLCTGSGLMVGFSNWRGTQRGSQFQTIFIGLLTTAPFLLIAKDFGIYSPTDHQWVEHIRGPWTVIAGLSWCAALASRRNFSRISMVFAFSLVGCWGIFLGAVEVTRTSEGIGLACLSLAGCLSVIWITASFRLFLGKSKFRIISRLPYGAAAFGQTIWLVSFICVGGMIVVEMPIGQASFLFALLALTGWFISSVVNSEWRGFAATITWAASAWCLAEQIHGDIPLESWWPFMAKTISISLATGTIFWTLIHGKKKGESALHFRCFTSLAACIAFLLPTQALVIATLVEPAWMSEIIRAPLAGWWNWGLAGLVFSVAITTIYPYRNIKFEVWFTLFILLGAGLAAAGATRGLDREENPEGILAVLATWSLGSLGMTFFQSRWAAIFSNLLLGFAWFSAWSRPDLLPQQSLLWCLIPATFAWISGLLATLVRGKRWLPLAASGSVMIALGAWTSFDSIAIGPGLLLGSFLAISTLCILEIRYPRGWLAPPSLDKSYRLHEPVMWLFINQILVIVGSFQLLTESGSWVWLIMAAIIQALILFLIRGKSSAILTVWQDSGYSVLGGLLSLAISKSFETSSLVPPMIAIIAGASMGLGARLLRLWFRQDSVQSWAAFPLSALGFSLFAAIPLSLPAGSTLFSKLFFSVAIIVYPALGFLHAAVIATLRPQASIRWSQVSLWATVLSIAFVIWLLFWQDIDGWKLPAAASCLFGFAMVIAWCEIAPHLDLNWKTTTRRAMLRTRADLLKCSIPFSLFLSAVASTSTTRSIPGFWEILAGLSVCALASIAGFIEIKNPQARMSSFFRAITLILSTILAVWLCAQWSQDAQLSRMFFLVGGCICLVTSQFKTIKHSRWEYSLEYLGMSWIISLAILQVGSLCLGETFVFVQRKWGMDLSPQGFTSSVIEISAALLIFGIGGLLSTIPQRLPWIRLSFAAWAICGWVGVSVSIGFLAGSHYLAILFVVAGILLGVRNFIGKAEANPTSLAMLRQNNAA